MSNVSSWARTCPHQFQDSEKGCSSRHADFGQTDFGQFWCFSVLANFCCWLCCLVVPNPKRHKPKTKEPAFQCPTCFGFGVVVVVVVVVVAGLDFPGPPSAGHTSTRFFFCGKNDETLTRSTRTVTQPGNLRRSCPNSSARGRALLHVRHHVVQLSINLHLRGLISSGFVVSLSWRA